MRNNCLLYSFDYNIKLIYDEKSKKLFFSVQPGFISYFLKSVCVCVCIAAVFIAESFAGLLHSKELSFP